MTGLGPCAQVGRRAGRNQGCVEEGQDLVWTAGFGFFVFCFLRVKKSSEWKGLSRPKTSLADLTRSPERDSPPPWVSQLPSPTSASMSPPGDRSCEDVADLLALAPPFLLTPTLTSRPPRGPPATSPRVPG